MIRKKPLFTAILLLLPFLYLFSAWGLAQGGGGGEAGGSDAGTSGGGTTGGTTSGGQQADRQRPMYLAGKVILDDGREPGQQVRIKLVCRGTVVRQEYTSHSGIFSLEVVQGGSTAHTLWPMDASASTSSYSVDGRNSPDSWGSETFTPVTTQRRQVDLSDCDLRAELMGYQSDVIRLGRRRALDSPDIGVIVLHSMDGAGGGTISLKTLAAPKKAKEAYGKAGKELTQEKPDYSKAVKELEKAVEIYPEFASAWYMLGEVRLMQKDRPAASEAYEHAKVSDSAYVSPYLSLALMALEEERWEEAADLCSQALELSPQLIKAHYLNALAHSSLGSFDIAEQSALLVQERNQAQIYPLVYYVLGFVESQRGDFSSAAAHYRSFLELRPDVSMAQQLSKQLVQWQQRGLIQSP